jgi:hypothetical protein
VFIGACDRIGFETLRQRLAQLVTYAVSA